VSRPVTIKLRCAACGKTAQVPREEYEPSRAATCETNGCDSCHASMGGFDLVTYYDKDDKELNPEEQAQEA